jgi:hypothetical protein
MIAKIISKKLSQKVYTKNYNIKLYVKVLSSEMLTFKMKTQKF